ncbi:MAG TPA: ActS/PrrB/RegB family redox-sensitive histidine kinase [Geminicoccaceae bacterium]|nr:ActS/PrrB/RegB family redox-sensitive histidine kinase [Geminicoccaceae bacterium]
MARSTLFARDVVPLTGWRERLRAGLTAGGEGRVRLRTLSVIRWVAVVGQAFTVLLVHISFEIALPLAPLFALIGLSALVNLSLTLALPATARLTERGAAALLGYDALQLACLLGLTGGLQNPFALLLLVPMTISATILSLRTTVALCGLTFAAVTVLAFYPTDLPWPGGSLHLPRLYVAGLWVAFSLGAVLIAGYAWRVAEEARRRTDALAATQMALAREQQLSALGGLAAAAAHELGSPLATIAVTANELARALPPDSPLGEDAAELVSQTERCREILAMLGRRPTSSEHSGEHEPFTRVPLSDLLGDIAASYGRPGVAVEVTVEGGDGEAREPHLAPSPELRHAFGNLIDNAIQFAARRVAIRIRPEPSRVVAVIEDDGPGFDPEVLPEIGEPYLSTRRADGGLGLGVFIASALLGRTGATLKFDNTAGGAQVTITWQRAALERFARAPEERRSARRGGTTG